MIKVIITLLFFSTSIQASVCDVLFNQPPKLLNIFTYERGFYPDFKKVNVEEFIPTYKILIERANARIAAIKKERATFKNTIVRLQEATEEIERLFNFFYVYAKSHITPKVKDIKSEIIPLHTTFFTTLSSDSDLFEKVTTVFNSRSKLSEDQRRLVQDYYDLLRNGGAKLSTADKVQYIALNEQLSQLRNEFQDNLLKYDEDFEIPVTEADLKGLPESTRTRLSAIAEENGKQGYLVKLEMNVVVSIMKYSENDELRKKVYLADNQKGYRSGKTDNSKIIFEIEEVSQKIAKLLGFQNAAAHELSQRMAQTVENVRSYVKELADLYKPYAEKEEKELADFVKRKFKEGKATSPTYEIWSREYWANKLKEEKFNFDEEKIREYLIYDNLEKAVFKLANSLYGITFNKRDDLPKPHKDVTVYEVRDGNETLAYVLVDPYSRMGTKDQGAWAADVTRTYIRNKKRMPGVFTVNMNYSKPSPGKPTTLTVRDATTLLHEWGHALHNILSDTNYRGQAGTQVKRDIVELPSQFMEGYFYEKDFLKWFAYNSKGEFLPDAYYNALIGTKNYRVANLMLRQLSLSLIDLAWFTGEFRTRTGTIAEVEKQVIESVTIFRHREDIAISPMFSHIFMGGYTAGYYVYKWAEKYSADLFSRFRRVGIFNREFGLRWRREFLAVGDSRDPAVAYSNAAGGDPDLNALLERDGLR